MGTSVLPRERRATSGCPTSRKRSPLLRTASSAASKLSSIEPNYVVRLFVVASQQFLRIAREQSILIVAHSSKFDVDGVFDSCVQVIARRVVGCPVFLAIETNLAEAVDILKLSFDDLGGVAINTFEIARVR